MFGFFNNGTKKICKESRRIALLTECDNQISIYPEFADSINRMKMLIDKAKKTKELDDIEGKIENLKLRLRDLYSKNQESKLIKANEAKEQEEKINLSILKKRLLAECTIPLKNMLLNEFADLDNIELKIFSDHDLEIFPPATKYDLKELINGIVAYEEKRSSIIDHIQNLGSLEYEQETENKVAAFKRLARETLNNLKLIQNTILAKRQLLNMLEIAESTLPPGIFSELNNPYKLKAAQQDNLSCNSAGKYINTNFQSALERQVVPEQSNFTLLSINPVTNSLYNNFKIKRLEIYQRITDYTINEEKASQKENSLPATDENLELLQNIIGVHQVNASTLDQVFRNHNEVLEYKLRIMHRHQLNLHNIDHLEFWSSQTHDGYLNGGVKITHNNINYYVPTRVHRMMTLLQQDYTNIPILTSDLEQARKSRPSFWNNPFSAATRSLITENFYYSSPNAFRN